MVILRCAWHPRNYGRAKLLGVSSWRGLELSFKDGLCKNCATRIHPDVRAQIGLAVPRRGCGTEVVLLLLSLAAATAMIAWPASGVRPASGPPLQVAPGALPRTFEVVADRPAVRRARATTVSLHRPPAARGQAATLRLERAVQPPSVLQSP
jgi:hypothetical protein